MNVTFIGGDRRMAVVASLLAERTSVRTYGLPSGSPCPVSSLFSALCGADVLVFPLPVTRDGIHPLMSAAETEACPSFAQIFSRAEEEALLLGGAIPAALQEQAAREGLVFADYYTGETLLLRNAHATAEAALAMAISGLPCTLCDCPVAIVGYGRIARALLPLLHACRADITVLARSDTARAEANAAGCKVYPILSDAPLSFPKGIRAVFYTVPAPLLCRDALRSLAHGTLVLDLAGGALDNVAAEEYGILHPNALSLPGRFSPESAGQYLFDEILTLIATKRGVHL